MEKVTIPEIFTMLLVVSITILSGCTNVDMQIHKDIPTYFDSITPQKMVSTPIVTSRIEIRTLTIGTILKRNLNEGKGELTIKNGLNFDAVVVLARSNNLKESVLSIYIQTGQSYTISSIPDYNYVLFYIIGKDWDNQLNEFSILEGSSRFEEELNRNSSSFT